jgi:dTDP-4-amino-4,6-dideoxygalactose transaminase
MWKVPLFDLAYDDRETKAVIEVLQSKWLSTGAKTEQFEQEFARYMSNETKAIAVANGTAALHLALVLAGVGPGDEVIISGLTFVADLNVVMHTGATPVIADCSSYDDWNVSPEDLRSKITERTKAVIVVHYAGYPCEMDNILAYCREKNIVVIEDAAHAIGGEYKGKKCGAIGDVGCFSFFSNKNLSVGEGGMVTTSSTEYYERARRLRSHGMTSMTVERHAGKTISYDVMEAGYNYRMDEIRSALGLVQLHKLDENNAKRKRHVATYVKLLSTEPDIVVPWKFIPPHMNPSFHIFPVLLLPGSDRQGVMNGLKKHGIQSSIHYPSFKSFTRYRDIFKEEIPLCMDISARVLTLPLYPDMTTAQIEYVVGKLGELLYE